MVTYYKQKLSYDSTTALSFLFGGVWDDWPVGRADCKVD